MNKPIDSRSLYLESIGASRDSVPAIRDLRERGRAVFAERGFPTVREEEWRYTNVSAIERQPFRAITTATELTTESLAPLLFSELNAHLLVFVDGRYAPSLSRVGSVPAGVMISSLAGAMQKDPDLVTSHLGKQANPEVNGFAALNAAGFADGALVYLKRGAVLAEPIHLIFVTSGREDSTLVQPRNLLIAETDSRATVLEHYVSAAEARYLTNAVTEVFVAHGAALEHYRLQQESMKAYHVNALHVAQSGASEFVAHGVDFGALLARNDLTARLDADGAACTLNGLYVADGRQHIDNHTRVDHLKPRATSREFYKGVLDGRARGVFAGRVVVHPEAQQTDAEQLNNNLLLSRDAEVDTKPQLEIYADDVKCSHGATVGQLDPDQLFYLQTRAIDDTTARDLLTYAFANDVLARFKLAPVRLALERRLTRRLLHGRELKELELV